MYYYLTRDWMRGQVLREENNFVMKPRCYWLSLWEFHNKKFKLLMHLSRWELEMSQSWQTNDIKFIGFNHHSWYLVSLALKCHSPYFEVYDRLHWWLTFSSLVSTHDTWRSSALSNILAWVCWIVLWGVCLRYQWFTSWPKCTHITHGISMLKNNFLMHTNM